jgi:hypothetical protein
MPRFDIVNVEPVISWPLSWRSRARLARSAISAAIDAQALQVGVRTTGVTRPSSIATATPTWTRWKRRIASPTHAALHAGTRRSAKAALLTIRSLTETLPRSPSEAR